MHSGTLTQHIWGTIGDKSETLGKDAILMFLLMQGLVVETACTSCI